MKIEIGKYYVGNFEVIKIMKKSDNPLIKNAYDVRRTDGFGIGWSTINEDIIKREYNEITGRELPMIKEIFDSDPKSKL
jgi:hypothetical protein